MARDPGVVAVQRRSMYQRVLDRVTFYEGWARTEVGLTDDEQQQLDRLRKRCREISVSPFHPD